jgi:FKBP-type peptidyl-prolyl cis-trans isomerase SlyD
MQIGKNTVVSLRYKLYDAQGELIEHAKKPITYLHGGYDGIFARVEAALAGKRAGDSCDVTLQPSDAFGDYDAELVHMEPQSKFPKNIKVGMRFEGTGSDSGHQLVYTVTDIADGKVVVDGNHPLAGKALRFQCTIDDVRPATAEEISHGHVHGAHGHHH